MQFVGAFGPRTERNETRPMRSKLMTNVAELALPSKTSAPKYGGIAEMTADEWISVHENPRQRDTEARAKRAKHLRELHPTHSRVNMARLRGSGLYKLDGHTRAFLWAKGTLEAPRKVYADVWDCSSIEEVKALYGTFDSKDAVETSTDKVFGGLKEFGLTFESELLKSQRFAGALRVASAMLHSVHKDDRSIYDLIEYWTPELILLDQCNPTRKRFHTGVAAAAFLSLRRFGPEAMPFWSNFAVGAGTKLGHDRDAVQALEERMEYVRNQKQITGSGNIVRVTRICLSAFEAYQRDHHYSGDSSGIKAMGDNSFSRFMAMAAKTKRRW